MTFNKQKLWSVFDSQWTNTGKALNISKKSQWNLRQVSHYTAEIWKLSGISTIRPTVHTNPARERSFLITLLKPEEVENARRPGVLLEVQNILLMELFDDVMIIRWFSWQRFLQSQIQNDRLLLYLQIPFLCFQSESSVFKFLKRSMVGAFYNSMCSVA